MQKTENFWKALSPSKTGELSELEKESYKEAKHLIKIKGRHKAEKALKQLLNIINIRKIAYDMYVWQRVDAVNLGIERALTNKKLEG
jgi:hypothetical protein